MLFRERTDPASLQSATNIANTRIGVGSQSRAVARFVSRRRGRFERSAAGFYGFVRVAMREDRSGKATMPRYLRGIVRVSVFQSSIGLEKSKTFQVRTKNDVSIH